LNESKTLFTEEMLALSFFCRRDSSNGKKIVNLLTNLPLSELEQRDYERYDKSTQQYEVLQRPKLIGTYNSKHNYIDKVKHRLAKIRHPHRSRRGWRVRANCWFYNLLINSFIYWRELQNNNSNNNNNNNNVITKRPTREWIMELSQAISSPLRPVSQPSPTETIIFHPVHTHPTRNSRVCRNCRKTTKLICTICRDLWLCSVQCSLKFHNANKTVER
jgi:hypothetical protein